MSDPAFAPMHVAVGTYADADNVCEPDLDLDQWQQVYLRTGLAQLLIKQAATKYMLRPRIWDPGGVLGGLRARLSVTTMDDNAAELDHILDLMKYGEASDHVQTPLSQQGANQLFLLADSWVDLMRLLQWTVSKGNAP